MTLPAVIFFLTAGSARPQKSHVLSFKNLPGVQFKFSDKKQIPHALLQTPKAYSRIPGIAKVSPQ
jgi:hypothetical protein